MLELLDAEKAHIDGAEELEAEVPGSPLRSPLALLAPDPMMVTDRSE